METQEKIGADLHGEDADARRAAAAIMGSSKSPAKLEAARKTAESRKGKPLSEETRRKQGEGQKRRWEQWKAQRAAETTATATEQPARKRGRPAKQKPADSEPKRPVGRPKKQQATEVAGDA